MALQTVKLGGRKFVIVPENDYRRLQEKAEEITLRDRGDVAEHRRRMKEPGGKTLAQVRSELRQ
jgi:PHD/YefM family antitoxin component YafN of YafNO toxin-antitoxin module